ncbi:Beta-1,3-glucosyltransferase [Winogradskyella psychrotolerans RS-3]|uniref:Beta-1,3-glucosyltransferase n=1 Tax=Winogradskyella psychrotolerans RS-3 TaxID=641526 RepID=S7VZ58_9FLAO|nr:glycosyltransferase family A protein [Winogradskyella psychrotolerans]EPR74697.1 Beta-1,3-glucosyltransferase [Winogradskyella psychrotolerans RS-3]
MADPRISIIVPCYNQAIYLDECLSSVIQQTYNNWECIIVNDGSPDHTEEVAKAWCEKDVRFKYIYQTNKGVSAARNLGISKAFGLYVLPLDGDDKIAEDYIENALSVFEKDAKTKVVYCKAKKFGDVNEDWVLDPFSLYNLSIKNMIFCSALFLKKDWEKIGGYDENMIHGVEDWEFWIAMLKKGGVVKQLDSVGFYYRIKEVSRQKLFDKEQYVAVLNYLSIKHADFFVEQQGNPIQIYRENIILKKFHSKVTSSFVYKMYKCLSFIYKKIK